MLLQSSMLSFGFLLAIFQVQQMQAEATPSSMQKQQQDTSQRYIILDTTSDSPSWTAVLMAMEASADPSNDFNFLGVLATDSEDLDTFNELMESTDMAGCLTVVSNGEEELYPLDGYALETAPAAVKQLVEWINAYPHQIRYYASSSLATLAYAEAIDASLGSKIAELVVVANLHDSNDFKNSGTVGFYENSPFIKNQDAFLATIGGSIPFFRIMGPLQPTLSGPEIATRVQEAVTRDAASSEDADAMLRARPFTWSYLMGHMGRMLAGHKQAILMQEPGMAILVNPALITGETDVEFTFEPEAGSELQAPILALRKIKEEDVDDNDRATVIYGLDSGKFWDMLVHTRSRDWNEFCSAKQRESDSAQDKATKDQLHDEL